MGAPVDRSSEDRYLRHHDRSTARRPRRHRRRCDEQPHRAGRQSGSAVAGDRALPRRRADDQLQVSRQRRRHGPRHHPADVFRKSSASITGPHDDIVKPSHVGLLDYEVEIGLVIGRDVPVGTTISDSALSDYVAGLVVTNDVSARDIQLPQTQFYEAKSYPSFTPTGPTLVLLSAEELQRFGDLRLQLRVNGQLRQNKLVDGDMIYPPVQALQSLTRFQDLAAGDLILTGTPVGTALSAPPKPMEIIGNLLPLAVKWKAFFKRQAGNPKYLHNGDVVETIIATDDGVIDLGAQRNTVRYA